MKQLKIYAFADEASSIIDEQIRAMKKNNLDGLEIRNVDGASVSDISLEKAREVRKKLADNNLVVWSVGSPIGKCDIDKGDFNQHLDKFRHTIEIARELEAENIRLFSFWLPAGSKPEDYRGEVMDRLGQFSDVAKGSGICLCHENEKEIYGDIAQRCLDIHRTFPEIKGIFDPANFVQCGQDTLEAWELLHPYIKYLHVKDAFWDGNVVPAGAGDGNVPAIISSFYKNGGRAVSIEPHLTIFKGLSELERESKKSNVGSFVYADAFSAFDAACEAVKKIAGR